MSSRRPALLLAALSLLAVWLLPPPAASEEYQCRRGDLVRRVEVRFADDPDRLPCQVMYWRDAADTPRVPWSADHQLEFCLAKAREMVEQLQAAGWSCAGAAPLPEDAAAMPEDAAPMPEDAAPLPEGAAPLPEDAAAMPEDVAPMPEDAAERNAREGASRAPAAGAAPLPAPARKPPTNGPAQPDQAALDAALARDLRRLDELAGGQEGAFEPEMARLGDLDGDGVADGAALLSHRAKDGGSSHHLLAYLFDGRTFRPVARVNLEAYYQNFTAVALADIADGGIELLLQTPRDGDPPCCPSGRRRATFELRGDELVLAAESDSGA